MRDTIDELTVLAIAEQLDGAPWTPPGMRVPRVGDNVRIRLSAECNWRCQSVPVLPGFGSPLELDRHPAALDGQAGTVEQVFEAEDDDHPYLVRFDALVRIATYHLARAASFAAAELVPLDAPDAGDAS